LKDLDDAIGQLVLMERLCKIDQLLTDAQEGVCGLERVGNLAKMRSTAGGEASTDVAVQSLLNGKERNKLELLESQGLCVRAALDGVVTELLRSDRETKLQMGQAQ
jgi:hypothetical protein